MNRLRVAPIVEGHGEATAVRILLERVWYDLGGEYIEVLKPWREKRNRLDKPEILRRTIESAWLKLRHSESHDPSLILVLVDRDPDTDPPCILGPRWLERARVGLPETVDVACVLANIEYETWFVAAAESLTEFLDLGQLTVPRCPEDQGCGKGWIQKHYSRPGRSYSEPIDQPAMTNQMDLSLCRSRSPSFDKLCRELEKRLRADAPPNLIAHLPDA